MPMLYKEPVMQGLGLDLLKKCNYNDYIRLWLFWYGW